MLMSCAVTAQLICAFVFAHAKNKRVSYAVAHFAINLHQKDVSQVAKSDRIWCYVPAGSYKLSFLLL